MPNMYVFLRLPVVRLIPMDEGDFLRPPSVSLGREVFETPQSSLCDMYHAYLLVSTVETRYVLRFYQ